MMKMLLKDMKTYYPTETALMLANGVRLFDGCEKFITKNKRENHRALYEDVPGTGDEPGLKESIRELGEKMLSDFQQSATLVSFDEAKQFFLGIEINEDQNTILKFIYDTTKTKVKGDMVNTMLSVIGVAPNDRKDYIEIILRMLTDPDSVDATTAERTINFIVKEAKKEVKVTRGK